MDKQEKSLLVVGGIAVGIGLLIGVPVWTGVVLSQLWAWFVVPAFHLSQISIAEAVGLSYIALMLARDPDAAKKDDKEAPWYVIALRAFIIPTFVLIFGYAVHLFL